MNTLATFGEAFPAVPSQVDVLGAWLAGRNANTLRAYRKDLDDFAAATGQPGASGAVAAFLGLDRGRANAVALHYRADMVDRGLSPATIARRLAALRSVVKVARILGRVDWELEVEAPKVESYRDTRGPGRDGWKAMVRDAGARAGEGDALAIRDMAIVRLLHDNGLRRGEVCALDLEDLDQEAGRVHVQGKGRGEKTPLTLADPTMRALAAWLEVRGTAPGPLFHRLDAVGAGEGRLSGEAVRLAVRRLGASAGLQAPVRPHGLRHQAVTGALASGHTIVEVMRFARHASPATTMIYDDNRQDVAGMVARSIAGD